MSFVYYWPTTLLLCAVNFRSFEARDAAAAVFI